MPLQAPDAAADPSSQKPSTTRNVPRERRRAQPQEQQKPCRLSWGAGDSGMARDARLCLSIPFAVNGDEQGLTKARPGIYCMKIVKNSKLNKVLQPITAAALPLLALMLGVMPARAFQFELLPGFTDADFNALKGCNPSGTSCPDASPALEENWVAEARGGDSGSAATFEQSINRWPTNAGPPTSSGFERQRTWTSGAPVPFTLEYTQATGAISYNLGGSTLTASGFTRVPPITDLFLRTNAATQNDTQFGPVSTSFSNLIFNLNPITETLDSTAVTNSSVTNYARISGITGDFTLTGDVTLAWVGTFPTQSRLDLTVKAMSVPAPLPLLGVAAAFSWSRKLRKRIRSTKSLPS
jgi:hypothetical protein